MEMDNRSRDHHLDHKNHIVAALRRQSLDYGNGGGNGNGNGNNSETNSIHSDTNDINNVMKRNGDENNKNSDNNNKGGGNGSDSDNNDGLNTGRWAAEEHKRFLAGLDQFG
jgi:hypothetical protein